MDSLKSIEAERDALMIERDCLKKKLDGCGPTIVKLRDDLSAAKKALEAKTIAEKARF